MLAKLAEEKEAADAKLAEELAAFADLPEEEKALKVEEAKLSAAKAALLAMKGKIVEIGRLDLFQLISFFPFVLIDVFFSWIFV
jgi:hypothetical protein